MQFTFELHEAINNNHVTTQSTLIHLCSAINILLIYVCARVLHSSVFLQWLKLQAFYKMKYSLKVQLQTYILKLKLHAHSHPKTTITTYYTTTNAGKGELLQCINSQGPILKSHLSIIVS